MVEEIQIGGLDLRKMFSKYCQKKADVPDHFTEEELWDEFVKRENQRIQNFWNRRMKGFFDRVE